MDIENKENTKETKPISRLATALIWVCIAIFIVYQAYDLYDFSLMPKDQADSWRGKAGIIFFFIISVWQMLYQIYMHFKDKKDI